MLCCTLDWQEQGYQSASISTPTHCVTRLKIALPSKTFLLFVQQNIHWSAESAKLCHPPAFSNNHPVHLVWSGLDAGGSFFRILVVRFATLCCRHCSVGAASSSDPVACGAGSCCTRHRAVRGPTGEGTASRRPPTPLLPGGSPDSDSSPRSCGARCRLVSSSAHDLPRRTTLG